MAAEGAEMEPLLGLCIDVCPHLIGRTVLDGDFPLIDLILNKKYFTLICLVRFMLLALPFVSSKIALILS